MQNTIYIVHVQEATVEVPRDQDVPGAVEEGPGGRQGSQLENLRRDCRAGPRHGQHHGPPVDIGPGPLDLGPRLRRWPHIHL